jgi:GNAT superfamily N-acetyltransferase
MANQSTPSQQPQDETKVEVVTNPSDFLGVFNCTAEAFGHQTHDAIYAVLNPGWDTPEGREAGARRFEERWRTATKNKNGEPNTVFLKATVPDPEDASKERIAGMAIWHQASFVPGYGEEPPAVEEPEASLHLSPSERKYAAQVFTSLHRRRRELTREKAETDPQLPAVFVLDMCAVDPRFQRRGIAGKLVQWGLDEARRRGGLECVTEASVMGRAVYLKKGFKMEEGAGEIAYEVDEEFKGLERPSNVFLRTGI